MSGKNGGLRLGDLGRRRGDQPGARLAVGAHEALGHVGARATRAWRPGSRRRSGPIASPSEATMWPAPSCSQLLRRRALQVDVVALALAEGRDHLVGGAGIDGRDRLEVEARA